MARARDDLKSAWDEARVFDHMGTRGSRREEAVRAFLNNRLPKALTVVTGQATDRFGNMSRQLDLMIYDSGRNSTLVDGLNVLLPAEALLAVVEVKSILDARELSKGLINAASTNSLRPYGKQFTRARKRGDPADDRVPRCFYTLLSRDSDLSEQNWLDREWARLVDAEDSEAHNLIDMLVILERGLLQPRDQRGMSVRDPGSNLQQWFVALTNFLAREVQRRDPVDWQMYGGKPPQSWVPLGQGSSQ